MLGSEKIKGITYLKFYNKKGELVKVISCDKIVSLTTVIDNPERTVETTERTHIVLQDQGREYFTTKETIDSILIEMRK